jgi:stress-induced morphogen
MGLFMDGLIDRRVEDHLGQAFAIPQINKNNPAVIPSTQDPAHQNHFRADIISTEFTTAVSSSHISQ